MRVLLSEVELEGLMHNAYDQPILDALVPFRVRLWSILPHLAEPIYPLEAILVVVHFLAHGGEVEAHADGVATANIEGEV